MIFKTPDIIFEELFTDLHKSGLWADGKAISDAFPKAPPKEILKTYREEKGKENFDLRQFFETYFEISAARNTAFVSDINRPVEEHIELLWDVLTREVEESVEGSSLIPLPHPYIVPGGRFNEIYYWDSYFTMLGLQVSGRIDLIEHMINNFSWLIDQIGFIPNGNRTYFMGRSQPPFYSLMVQLLAEERGKQILANYLPFLLKEYQFWMDGMENQDSDQPAYRRIVNLGEGKTLNRYHDNFQQPRAEMYSTDEEDCAASGREAKAFYLDIRSACESGWDFSARWFEDKQDIGTIRTSQILPVDLNCLMLHLEETLAEAYQVNQQAEESTLFTKRANQRRQLIHQYFWNPERSFFHDYNFQEQKQTDKYTLAAMFPLFFKVATAEQAAACAKVIEDRFLKAGGLINTTIHSGQQWDAPNGWAPLQWISIQGLRNYGFTDLANTIRQRWVRLNTEVYQRTGKLMEKYNTEDISLLSGGGEYPVQDGFGWTNGVLLKLIKE